MAAIGRQIQLRWGTEVLDLTIAPFTVLANQGFVSAGENLEIRTRVDAVTLSEVERAVSMVRSWLCNAAAWNDSGLGKPVEIWTKTCDNLTVVAEIGATWRKKEIRGGDVIVQPKAGTAATPTADVQISLQVEPTWRRAAPAPLLWTAEQRYPISLVANAQGWLTALDGTPVMARHMSWSASTGLTVRHHFVIRLDQDCYLFNDATLGMYASWLVSSKQFRMRDSASHTATSSAFTFIAGDVVDVIFRWSETLGMGIWVNGVKVGSNATCDIGTIDPPQMLAYSYQVLTPVSGYQAQTANIQIWPSGLTDAECAGLYAFGRPEPELPFVINPTSSMQYQALYRLGNGPGNTWSPLQLWTYSSILFYLRVQVGWRPGRELELLNMLSHGLPCENATLGTGTTRVADANTWRGYVARVTPTDTNWVTRVTLALANDPEDVLAVRGEHRLMLACRDASASKNLVRWRLVVADKAGDWSEATAPHVMSTYSLVDVGRVVIPPGKWPEASFAAASSLFSGTYIKLEVQVQNSVGSGGGTFDLDSVFLFPAEGEGKATVLWPNAAAASYVLLDWSGESPSFVTLRNTDSFEFAAWVDYVGDEIAMLPHSVGVLTLAFFRDSYEQAYMLDPCDVIACVEPRWA